SFTKPQPSPSGGSHHPTHPPSGPRLSASLPLSLVLGLAPQFVKKCWFFHDVVGAVHPAVAVLQVAVRHLGRVVEGAASNGAGLLSWMRCDHNAKGMGD